MRFKNLLLAATLLCAGISGCSEDNTTQPDPTPVVKNEPTSHPTQFAATAITDSTITLTWQDATGEKLPERYIILAAEDPAQPPVPRDSIAPIASGLTKSIAQGVQMVTFTSLKGETKYNFAIYPYAGTGTTLNYKTDGTVAKISATTLKRIIPPSYILPLKVGNSWNYKTFHIDYSAGTTVDAGKDYTMEVIGDTLINGSQWFKVTNFYYGVGGISLLQNSADGLWRRINNGDAYLFYKYPATVNSTFSRDNSPIKLISASETVKVQAGTFACYNYHEDVQSAVQENEYVAPNKGIVKFFSKLTDPTGDIAISQELQSFTLK